LDRRLASRLIGAVVDWPPRMAQGPGCTIEGQHVTTGPGRLVGSATDWRTQKVAQQQCTHPAMRDNGDVARRGFPQYIAHRGDNSHLGVYCAFPSTHAL